jgi:hypothetical protein
MSAIKFKCSGENAFGVHQLILGFSGDEGFYQKRCDARDKIIKVWPEFTKPVESAEEEAERNQVVKQEREIEFTSSEQMAVVDGALHYIKNKGNTDNDKDQIKRLAKLLKFSNHLTAKLAEAAKGVKGFTDSDEVIVPDAPEGDEATPAQAVQNLIEETEPSMN